MSSTPPTFLRASAFPLPFGWSTSIAFKDASVNVSHLSPKVVLFLVKLAGLHSGLFDVPLVVTSGNDGQHTAGSKHAQNKAADVRVNDLPASAQLVFLQVICFLAPSFGIAVFDERALTSGPHIHLEEAA